MMGEIRFQKSIYTQHRPAGDPPCGDLRSGFAVVLMHSFGTLPQGECHSGACFGKFAFKSQFIRSTVTPGIRPVADLRSDFASVFIHSFATLPQGECPAERVSTAPATAVPLFALTQSLRNSVHHSPNVPKYDIGSGEFFKNSSASSGMHTPG